MTTVRELMSHTLRSVDPSAPMAEVRDLMAGEALGAVAVLDGDRLVGIVSATDLVQGWSATQPVSSMVSQDVLTVAPSDTAVAAASTMVRHSVHHLVVVDDGRPVAMLSAWDLLHALL
jgi:CBS domain-containing protein